MPSCNSLGLSAQDTRGHLSNKCISLICRHLVIFFVYLPVHRAAAVNRVDSSLCTMCWCQCHWHSKHGCHYSPSPWALRWWVRAWTVVRRRAPPSRQVGTAGWPLRPVLPLLGRHSCLLLYPQALGLSSTLGLDNCALPLSLLLASVAALAAPGCSCCRCSGELCRSP